MTEVISIIQFLISISGLLMKSISLLLIWWGWFCLYCENDADIMHNSVSINLNVLEEQRKLNKSEVKTKIFYSGSACMYPEHNQLDPDNPDCREESAYLCEPYSSMDGRNSSVNVYTLLIIVITHPCSCHSLP